MMSPEDEDVALAAIKVAIKKDYSDRIAAYPIDLFEPELSEVVAGLLSRQSVLALQLLQSPNAWNQHTAPLFHRVMADVHITLAYILEGDAKKRARDYILYGLGQEKLSIAHYEARQAEHPEPAIQTIIDARRRWLETQRHEILTEVNVGSATGLSTREMAQRSGNEGLYKFNFTPFSAAVHSTWQHVARYNLQVCTSPLHGHHLIGVIADLDNDLFEVRLAIRNLCETLELADKALLAKVLPTICWNAINELIMRLDSEREPDENH
jgi:hypothetical protein